MPKAVPKLPWERAAISLLDRIGTTNIIIADSYSGFIDYQELRNASSNEVISALKRWYSTHATLRGLESHNGTCFDACKFQNLRCNWGCNYITFSPRYPKSNELAERAVQVVTNLLKKCIADISDIQLALLSLQHILHNRELGSPVQLLFSRRTRPGVNPQCSQRQ